MIPDVPTPEVAPDECRDDAKLVGLHPHVLVC